MAGAGGASAKFLLGLTLLATPAAAQAQTLRPDQVEFRALYKELVETNTQFSNGSCTDAAAKMGARLKAAGFQDSELTYFTAPDHPREGGLVAVMKGSDPRVKPFLLLGHIDVVEARREDWTRDPYAFIEENGFFYGRGVADMKAMDAIWVDTLIRMRKAGETPKRTIKMALTCGEESAGPNVLNGARWLVENRPDLIDAEFVLTEGGGGRVSDRGVAEVVNLQVGEKAAQDFKLEVTNPGGHSSRPMPDNAIYRLTDAIGKIRAYSFPVHFTDTTRVALKVRAEQNDSVGKALTRLMANPADAKAAAEASADPSVNAVLRTTCVATRLDAGHATNALPQRATANINCRIFPGESVATTQATLVRLIGDPKVAVTLNAAERPLAVSPPLTPRVVEPAERLAAKHFPGVPFTPMMMTGATDGRYFGVKAIPVYGAPGLLTDALSNTHGLNERIPVKSVYAGRDYLYELVREYAAQGAN